MCLNCKLEVKLSLNWKVTDHKWQLLCLETAGCSSGHVAALVTGSLSMFFGHGFILSMSVAFRISWSSSNLSVKHLRSWSLSLILALWYCWGLQEMLWNAFNFFNDATICPSLYSRKRNGINSYSKVSKCTLFVPNIPLIREDLIYNEYIKQNLPQNRFQSNYCFLNLIVSHR